MLAHQGNASHTQIILLYSKYGRNLLRLNWIQKWVSLSLGPLRVVFPFAEILWISEHSLVNFYSWMFWGLFSLVQILKVEVPDVGFKLFAP